MKLNVAAKSCAGAEAERRAVRRFIVPLAMVAGAPITTAQFVSKNLLPVVLGNTVGGVLLIATFFSLAYGRLGGSTLPGATA